MNCLRPLVRWELTSMNPERQSTDCWQWQWEIAIFCGTYRDLVNSLFQDFRFAFVRCQSKYSEKNFDRILDGIVSYNTSESVIRKEPSFYSVFNGPDKQGVHSGVCLQMLWIPGAGSQYEASQIFFRCQRKIGVLSVATIWPASIFSFRSICNAGYMYVYKGMLLRSHTKWTYKMKMKLAASESQKTIQSDCLQSRLKVALRLRSTELYIAW
jgi:hypothetical protein